MMDVFLPWFYIKCWLPHSNASQDISISYLMFSRNLFMKLIVLINNILLYTRAPISNITTYKQNTQGVYRN